MSQSDFLEIVKHTEGWALRRGDRSPNLLTSPDRDALIGAGRRIAIAFGLPLLVDGRPVAQSSDGAIAPGRNRNASA